MIFSGSHHCHLVLEQAMDLLFGPPVAIPGVGKAGRYFANALMQLWKAGLQDDVAELLKDNSGYEIWVCFHKRFERVLMLAQ